MFSICYNSRVESRRYKKFPQRKPKIKPFTNKYKQEGLNFPSERGLWEKTEKNNIAIALHVLYAKKKNIYILLMFKNTTQIVKKVTFLMIPNDGKQHYLTVKKLSIIKRNNF